jgi:SAM-dependent methyltransferase
MAVDAFARHAGGCLCCGETSLEAEYTIVSPYLAFKAFGSGPVPCLIVRCPACDFPFYDRGLTDEEGAAYYAGYRDETYFRERNKFEPYYTRKIHDTLTEQMGSDDRRRHVAGLFNTSAEFETIIDYGGGDGALITELSATRRISFDPSNVPPRPGVEIICDRSALPADVDLITCAQVLEHVSDPGALLDDMLSMLRPGGMLYVEVPDQLWKRVSSWRLSPAVADWLCRNPRLLLAADIYSTAFRVKLGVLPPFGFVPMREHINFFSAAALRSIVQQRDLSIRTEGSTDAGGHKSFYLLAEKRDRNPRPNASV